MTLDDRRANGGITADLVDRRANCEIAEVNACDNHHPHGAPIFEENLEEAPPVKEDPHALLNDVINAEANAEKDHADPDVPPEPPPGFIETILKMTVPSDNGKKLIREYADTSDAQQAFVVVEHLKSTKAQLNAPKLLAYLTTVKLAACNRNGSYEFFILLRHKEYKDSGSHLSSTVEWSVTEKAHQEPLSRRHREYKGSHWSFTDEWSENGEAVEDVTTSNVHIPTTVIIMLSSHAAPHNKHLGKFKCMYVCPAKLKTRLSTFAWKNQEQIIDACSTLRCSKDLVHGETVMSGDNEFVSNSSMPSTESMRKHCGMGRLGQFSCRSYSSDVGYYRLLIWHRSSYRFGTKGSDKINTRFPGRDSYPL
jgi:hypothetical protein